MVGTTSDWEDELGRWSAASSALSGTDVGIARRDNQRGQTPRFESR
jgi:hypothetical protein